MKLRQFAAAAAVLLAATAAQAHSNVQWSLSIGVPGFAVAAAPMLPVAPVVYAQPYPVVYTQPYPVYVQPYRVYAPAPIVVAPRVRYPVYRPVMGWDHDGDGIPNRYDRHPGRYGR